MQEKLLREALDLHLIRVAKHLKEENIKIVIGPISHEDFKNLTAYKNMIFISPSNISADTPPPS